MAILFSIDIGRLQASQHDVSSPFSDCSRHENIKDQHSLLSSDEGGADVMLAKLVRIHRRQVESGSMASNWDPLNIWYSMLRDCCKRDQYDS